MAKAKVKFYLKDVTESYGLKGLTRLVPNVLHFSLSYPNLNGETSVPGNEFDNIAAEAHVRNYPDAYQDFKNLNPDYVLAWPELDVAAQGLPAPEVAELPAPESAPALEAPKEEDQPEAA